MRSGSTRASGREGIEADVAPRRALREIVGPGFLKKQPVPPDNLLRREKLGIAGEDGGKVEVPVLRREVLRSVQIVAAEKGVERAEKAADILVVKTPAAGGVAGDLAALVRKSRPDAPPDARPRPVPLRAESDGDFPEVRVGRLEPERRGMGVPAEDKHVRPPEIPAIKRDDRKAEARGKNDLGTGKGVEHSLQPRLGAGLVAEIPGGPRGLHARAVGGGRAVPAFSDAVVVVQRRLEVDAALLARRRHAPAGHGRKRPADRAGKGERAGQNQLRLRQSLADGRRDAQGAARQGLAGEFLQPCPERPPDGGKAVHAGDAALGDKAGKAAVRAGNPENGVVRLVGRGRRGVEKIPVIPRSLGVVRRRLRRVHAAVDLAVAHGDVGKALDDEGVVASAGRGGKVAEVPAARLGKLRQAVEGAGEEQVELPVVVGAEFECPARHVVLRHVARGGKAKLLALAGVLAAAEVFEKAARKLGAAEVDLPLRAVEVEVVRAARAAEDDLVVVGVEGVERRAAPGGGAAEEVGVVVRGELFRRVRAVLPEGGVVVGIDGVLPVLVRHGGVREGEDAVGFGEEKVGIDEMGVVAEVFAVEDEEVEEGVPRGKRLLGRGRGEKRQVGVDDAQEPVQAVVVEGFRGRDFPRLGLGVDVPRNAGEHGGKREKENRVPAEEPLYPADKGAGAFFLRRLLGSLFRAGGGLTLRAVRGGGRVRGGSGVHRLVERGEGGGVHGVVRLRAVLRLLRFFRFLRFLRLGKLLRLLKLSGIPDVVLFVPLRHGFSFCPTVRTVPCSSYGFAERGSSVLIRSRLKVLCKENP